MESWRQVWREGYAKVLPTDGLTSLRDALASDDQRLVQGATTKPPPLMCVRDWPVEACCAVGWTLYKGESRRTVGDVERHFGDMNTAVDAALKSPGGCRWFLNAYDDWPRTKMIANLLPEVEYALAQRGIGSAPDPLDPGASRVGESAGLQAGG